MLLASEEPLEWMVRRCTAPSGRRDDRGALIGAPSRDVDGQRRIVMAVRSSSPPFPFGAAAPERVSAATLPDFLKEIDRRVPDGLDLHIVMDNYATHKTAAVKAWLARRAHWHVHFTPTSTSWINQVERWFAELTRKQLQRGVHTSTRQLEADIRAFIEQHNEDPKPFKWTKSADDILAAVKRFCLRVDQHLCHEL